MRTSTPSSTTKPSRSLSRHTKARPPPAWLGLGSVVRVGVKVSDEGWGQWSGSGLLLLPPCLQQLAEHDVDVEREHVSQLDAV